MGCIVAFDYQSWIARYPEFTSVSPASVQECWNEATLYVRNDGGGPVSQAITQSILLNMVAAHIVFLYFGTGTSPANQAVGRIAGATEGSVSVTLQNDYPPGTPQWFQQTKYGSSFWAASAAYRTMRYAPSPGAGNPFAGPIWGGTGAYGTGR